jgi:hypothetical protein
MTDTQIVNAIQARMDGVYDDPDLLLIGALHEDSMEDIAEILSMRVELPVSTEERERMAGTVKEYFPHDVCPGCGKPSVPLEGVPDQSGRGCGQCGREWFEDMSRPEQTA